MALLALGLCCLTLRPVQSQRAVHTGRSSALYGGRALVAQLDGAFTPAVADSVAGTTVAVEAGEAALRAVTRFPGEAEQAALVAPVPSRPSADAFGEVAFGKVGPPESGLPVAVVRPEALNRFIWPGDSRRVSTVFARWHQAIDVDEWPAGGNSVRAAADGIVTFAGGEACCSYGRYVIVQHTDGFSSLYAHLSSLEVSLGQVVLQGEELGRSGCTGSCTGDHLHFAIYDHGAPLDPLAVLPPGAAIE